MATNNRPSFGWLIFGMCWGTLIGHAVMMCFFFPGGFWSDNLRFVFYGTLGGAMVGVGGGAILDGCATRSTRWLDWVVLVGAAGVYVFFWPALNPARE